MKISVSKEVKVGFLTIVALAILFVGFRFLKGIDFFDPSTTYYVIYDDVDGLTVSNPVVVNGFRVGRVSEINLLQDGGKTRMLVGIEVNEDLILYQGTEAVLVNDNPVLGGKTIVLNIDGQGPVLQEGDTLRSIVDESLAEMIKERADPIVSEIDTTLRRVNLILEDLSTTGGRVGETLGEFQLTAEALKMMVVENRRDISALTTNLSLLSATLNDPQTGVGPILVKVNALADSLNDLPLKAAVVNAALALDNIQEITRSIQQAEGTLGKLIYSDSLYANLNQSTENLNMLINDIQQNPKRYIDLRFSLIGGGKK